MVRLLVSFSTLCSAPPPALGSVKLNADPELYHLTARLAVSVLPEPLQAFFRLDADEWRGFCALAADPNLRYEAPAYTGIFLDITAKSGERRARFEAVREFRADPEKAKAAQKRLKARYDPVPEIVETRFTELVRAFRSDSGDVVRDRAALLIHHATVAAMPFNTTSGMHVGAAEPMEFLLQRRTRYHGELIRRLKGRLEIEARIDPNRLQPTSKALDAAFETAIEAYHAIDTLLEMETSLAEEIVVNPADVTAKATDEFLDKLAERASPVLEARIEAGALLAANLIVGAWIEAGQPPVVTAVPNTDAKASPPPQTPADVAKSDAPFVGSKDSNIFHRATCVHVARMKPENRVFFENSEKAKVAARTPCKTCKPDAPSPP